MSRYFAALAKAESEAPLSQGVHPSAAIAGHSGEYSALIRRLFDGPAAVAVIGNGCRVTVTNVCEAIAAQLGNGGKRVLIVTVDALMRMNPLTKTDLTTFAPGQSLNTWCWPAPVAPQIEFFKLPESDGVGNWLDTLRGTFDSVLLDCSVLEAAPGNSEVAAMADAVILAVEAGQSSKRQILRDQRALRLRGANLAGFVLIQRR